MIKIFILIIGGMLFSVLFVSSAQGYGVETHALLTREIVGFYNSKYSSHKIGDELSSYLIDGARHEDTNPRYLNHFYDPVNDRGLADGVFAGQGSKYWAQDGDNQKDLIYKFFARTGDSILTASQLSKIGSVRNQTDFTWQKAIDLYARGKDEQAIFALGHIIHLIEDASVPDHTRNDAHPPFDDGGSPYENWTKRFDLENPDPDLSGRLANKRPYLFADLDGYFNSMANYSNNNFYSRDSIKSFSPININSYRRIDNLNFGMVSDDSGLYNLFIGGDFEWNKTDIQTINHPFILSDYWSRLSTKAVQHGAGVIDLFFDEAEVARAKYQREKSGRPYLGLLLDGVGIMTGDPDFSIDNLDDGMSSNIFFPPIVEDILTESLSSITSASIPDIIITSPLPSTPFLLSEPSLSPIPTATPIVLVLSEGESDLKSSVSIDSLVDSVVVNEKAVSILVETDNSNTVWLSGSDGSGLGTSESSGFDIGSLLISVEEPSPTPESTPEVVVSFSASPSYFSEVEFYKNNDGKHYLKLVWDNYPFIPVNFGHLISGQPAPNNWHVVLLYYNQDAPSLPENIMWNNFSSNDLYRAWGLIMPGGLKVKYPNCLGRITTAPSLILPDGSSGCSALATNMAASAYLYSSLRGGGVVLEVSPDSFSGSEPVSGQDFVSIAYYAYQPGYEPNNYGLRFVSVDSNRYYLK